MLTMPAGLPIIVVTDHQALQMANMLREAREVSETKEERKLQMNNVAKRRRINQEIW